MTKAKVISIANHKGGVGKTTTAASVGTALAMKGYRVLLVDMDPQANLTQSLMPREEVKVSIYDALTSSGNTQLPLYNMADYEPDGHKHDTLDLVPATLELAYAEMSLVSALAREEILKNLIGTYIKDYDYIIIDCPPSLGILTINAVTASDYVIIPLVAEVLPFVGLTMISNFIERIKKYLNPEVSTLGILLTRYERTKLSRDIEDGLRSRLGDLVFKTKIRKNITVAQAPMEHVNIVDYDPQSNGAIDYMALTNEIEERLNNK